MSSFMDRFMGRKPTPAQSAKDRLKFVLVTDRTTISPEDLRKMQEEILDVIRKYCRVNEDAVDMKFEQRDRENYLVADIPLSAGRPDDPAGTVRIQTSITTSSDDTPDDDSDKKDDQDDDKADSPPEASSSDTNEDSKPDAEDADEPVQAKGAPAGLSAEKSDDNKSEADAPASDEDQKKEDD